MNSARLNEITITGFKSRFATMNIRFTEQNVSVIYGDNGCGKTTLLNLIHAIFTQNDEELAKNSIESIKLFYTVVDDDGKVSNKRNVIKRHKQTDSYSWPDDSIRHFKSLSLGVGRTLNSTDTPITTSEAFRFLSNNISQYNFIDKNVEPERLWDFSEDLIRTVKRYRSMHAMKKVNVRRFADKNLYLKSIKTEEVVFLLLDTYRIARIRSSNGIQNALFETLSSFIFNTSPEDFNSYSEKSKHWLFESLIINKSRIIKALDTKDGNQAKIEIVDKLTKINSRESFDQIVSTPILFQLFTNMIDQLAIEESLLTSINEILYVFNSHLPPNKKLVVNEHAVEVNVGTESHPISELSSGESQLLITLCMLVLRGQDKHVILIDEPELSFNIRWQRMFIDLVTAVVPNAQVIVASHSPAVAGASKYKTSMDIELGGAL